MSARSPRACSSATARPCPGPAGLAASRFADVIKLMFRGAETEGRRRGHCSTSAPHHLGDGRVSRRSAVVPVRPADDAVRAAGGAASADAADVNVAVLVIFAIASMGVYGIVLAGWSSNSKHSLLGGLRSSAQMISYEL